MKYFIIHEVNEKYNVIIHINILIKENVRIFMTNPPVQIQKKISYHLLEGINFVLLFHDYCIRGRYADFFEALKRPFAYSFI